MEIRKYTAAQLKAWTESQEYQQLENVPVSRLRVYSYVHNPRLADKNGVIAYLAFDGNELVAYRTLLPDRLLLNAQTVNLHWFSGSWVHPSQRRKGIASQLLQEIVKDKGNALGASNWAPASKKVYDKSGLFETLNQTGIRCYMRFDLATILEARFGKRKLNHLLLKAFDKTANVLAYPFFAIRKYRWNKSALSFEYLHIPDNDCLNWLTRHERFEPNLRGKAEFEWICSYPWIKEAPLMSEQNSWYYFSSTAKRFNQFVVKFYYTNTCVGFAMVTLRDGFMKVPYWYVERNFTQDAVVILLQMAQQNKTCTLTTTHPDVVSVLRTHYWGFWAKKDFQHGFFLSKELFQQLPANAFFQDGDADGVFV
jgi:GNAT superfamily N-acetyltransferase